MKRVTFIGQAMPRSKRHPHDWPSLNIWLYSIGITDKQIKNNFLYSALVDYFPGLRNGSHRVPVEHEIKKERINLRKAINNFKPDLVVPVGKLSISYCLDVKTLKLENHVGKVFIANPYGLYEEKTLIIPFPHPSGASCWCRHKENAKLLQVALSLLKTNLY